MNINCFTVIATVINIALLFAIIIGIYIGIRGLKNFINRNKATDKKIDAILNKLENKEDN